MEEEIVKGMMIRYRSVGNLVFSNQQAVTKRTRERIHKIADNRSIERRIEREIEIIKDKETLTSGESKRKEQRLLIERREGTKRMTDRRLVPRDRMPDAEKWNEEKT